MQIGIRDNKTRANTGTPQFGGSVQFSIPQFGKIKEIAEKSIYGEVMQLKNNMLVICL